MSEKRFNNIHNFSSSQRTSSNDGTPTHGQDDVTGIPCNCPDCRKNNDK